jgi:hypothetical protein
MSFWPWWTNFDLYWLHIRFLGPGKPSSPVTTLSNRSRPTSRWFIRGRMRHQDDGRAGRSLGAKTLSREQSPDFDLVGTSWMVAVCETRGATYMTCWSCSSPAGCTPIWIATTLSNMSDRLPLQSFRSMFCYIGWMVQRMAMVTFIMIITVFTLINLMMLALCML